MLHGDLDQVQPVHGLPADGGILDQAGQQVKGAGCRSLGHHHQGLPQGLDRILREALPVGRQQGQGGVVAEHGAEGWIGRHLGHGIIHPVILGDLLRLGSHLLENGMDGVLGEKTAQGGGGKRVGDGVEMGQIDRADRILGQIAGILAGNRLFLHQEIQPGGTDGHKAEDNSCTFSSFYFSALGMVIVAPHRVQEGVPGPVNRPFPLLPFQWPQWPAAPLPISGRPAPDAVPPGRIPC